MNQDSYSISGFSDEIAADFDRQLSVVRTLGMKYIELRGADGLNVAAFSEEKEDELVSKLKNAGIWVSSIGSPLGKTDIRDAFEPQLDLLQQLIRFGKKLGTRYIRIFSFYMPKDEVPEKYQDEVLERLRRLRDVAAEAGVVLLHENEKGIFGDTSVRCALLMRELYGPAFRAVFDFANYIQRGEDTWAAYELLKPYIEYIHVKDAEVSGEVVPPGCGAGQIRRILQDLKACGYKGFLSLEPHLAEFSGLAALEQGGIVSVRDTGKDAEDDNKGERTFCLAYHSLKKILTELQWM